MSTEPQGPLSHTPPGRRLALLVGVNGESNTPGQEPLKHAVHDAEVMAQVLQEDACGFQLFPRSLLGEQATTDEVRRAIFDLVDEVQEGDFALFYFSGHAVPVLGQEDDVYLVTHNFVQPRPGRGQYEISFKFLREQLFEHKKAQYVVVILDCCFAGMFSDSAQDPYLEDILYKLRKYFQEAGTKSPSLPGAERLVISATSRTTASERDGHGLMTKYILEALKGEVPDAANKNDQITHHRLADYLVTELSPDQKPWFSGSSHHIILATHPGLKRRSQQSAQEQRQLERWQETFSESNIVKKRLEGFVGRAKELDDVNRIIAKLLPQGGYLVITGEAGQGKSSLIAKLVESFASKQGGFDKVVHHFIPSELRSRGRHYLLSELLKRLILKYPHAYEPDFSGIGESDLSMNERFQEVLKEIVKQKGQEVIFIDGLDQLVIDREIGQLDISFLPQDMTRLPGIVFVLGTRPNQTLTLLKHKKPSREYQLGGLSRDDFMLLLGAYGLSSLPPSRGNHFYEKSGGHTLFLSVLIRELSSQPGLIEDNDIEEILKHINTNPEQVFELTMNRLGLQEKIWESVSKPLLKLLLVAEEALTRSQIKQLLKLTSSTSIDSDRLKQGLEHLGGLIVQQQYIRQNDPQERYTLGHLLLRTYLQTLYKEDLQEQHRHFVVWCEQEKHALFWELAYDDAIQERRSYARHHYLTHLYQAHSLDTLFTILDEGKYGKARLLEDPSGRSYERDLSWGQQAAANISSTVLTLPRLWHYTLLRCSLTSRAGNYSESTFHLLLLLGPEQERKAFELAEMLTLPDHQARVFTLIASHLAASDRPERQHEASLLAHKAEQIVRDIADDAQNVDLLRKLSDTMRRSGFIQEAEQMEERAGQISRALGLDAKDDQLTARDIISIWLANRALDDGKAEALVATSLMLEEVTYWIGNEPIWRHMRRLIHTLPNTVHKARVLTEFAFAEECMGHRHPAQGLRSDAIAILAAPGDEAQQEIILTRFMETLKRVRFSSEIGKTWEDIQPIVLNFSDGRRKARVLTGLASSLVQIGRAKEARRILSAFSDEYEQAKQLISPNLSSRELIRALSEFVRLLSETGNEAETDPLLQRGESMISVLPENQTRVEDLVMNAMKLREAGHQEEALYMLLSLEDTWRKIQELANLGTYCMRIGQTSHLREIKQKVEELIHEVAEDEHDTEVVASLERLINQEEGREQRINELIELTLDLWQRGWNLEAEQYFQKIAQIIRSIPDETSRHPAWLKLVEARGQTRNWTAVKGLDEEFSLGRNKADYLALQGALLGRAGRSRAAENIIETILNQSSNVKTLDSSDETIATSVLDDDSIDPILKTIRDKALVKLAEVYWQTRSWAYAENVIQSMYDKKIRNDMLAKQAEMMGWDYVMHPVHSTSQQEERDEHVKKMLEDLLLNIIRVIVSLEDVWKKFQTFTTLSEIMVDNSFASEARKIGEEAEALFSAYESAQANHILRDEKPGKIALFARLGTVFVRIGDRQKAEHILQEVEKDILSLFHGESEDQALERLADALVQVRSWSEAWEVIDAIVDQTIKDRLLFDLTNVLIELELWEQAEQAGRSIQNTTSRTLAHSNRDKAHAQWLAKRASILAGDQSWSEAKKVIASIPDQIIKDEALSDLGYLLALAQRWQEADEVIRLIKEQGTKNLALLDLTNLLIEAKLWEQADRVARSIEDFYDEDSYEKKALENLKNARIEEAWESRPAEAGDARRIPRVLERRPESRPPVLHRHAPSPAPSVLSVRPTPRTQRKVPEKVPSASPVHAIPRKERRAHEESERIRSLQKQWLKAATREQALEYFTPVCELIPDHPELGIRLWNAFKHVNSFLEGLASTNTTIQ